jgi:hypothetical protein
VTAVLYGLVTYDTVESSKIGCSLHHFGALAVIHVNGNWDLCVLRRLSSGVEEKAIGVFDCPWEQLQDHWRVFGFGCPYAGNDTLNIVETHCWHGPASCGSCIDDSLCAVVGRLRHGVVDGE